MSESRIDVFDFPEDYDGDEPCPMGCGRLTEDAAGGPCEACWAELYHDDDE